MHNSQYLSGVNVLIRSIIQKLSGTVQLVKETDNSFSFHTNSTIRNSVIKFTPGQEFIEDTPDGRKIRCIVTFEGNKMIQQQFGDRAARVEREFFEDQLITKCIYGDVVATRWFKAME